MYFAGRNVEGKAARAQPNRPRKVPQGQIDFVNGHDQSLLPIAR
jgi:hypothetical protein